MKLIRALLASILFYVVGLSCSREPAPKAATLSRLKGIERAIYVLEAKNQSAIDQQLARVVGGASIEEKWLLLVSENAGRLGMSSSVASDILCRDGFGRAFNVDYRTNVAAHNAASWVTNSVYNVIIWSNGANGINEYGHGDDVFFVTEQIKASH